MPTIGDKGRTQYPLVPQQDRDEPVAREEQQEDGHAEELEEAQQATAGLNTRAAQTAQRLQATRPTGKVTEEQGREQVREQRGLPQPGEKKLSAADAERLMSQSGYQKANKKRLKGFDIGDSVNAPIPLPEDDVDEQAWSQQGLDDAQEELTLHSGAFAEMTQEVAGGADMFAALIGQAFTPTEADIARLTALAQGSGGGAGATEAQINLKNVQSSLQGLFGVKLGAATQGQTLLGTALVVAGHAESVEGSATGLETSKLCNGMQKVVTEGNDAVASARSMAKGINKELSVQRTLIFKR